MKRALVFSLALLVLSCTKETSEIQQSSASELSEAEDIIVEAVIEMPSVRVSGTETSESDLALKWEKGDVISACWKDGSSIWHRVFYFVQAVSSTTAYLAYLEGDRPGEGAVLSAISTGSSKQYAFDGKTPASIDFSDQSDVRFPVLLFSKSTVSSGKLEFVFTVQSALVRFASLSGLPDLDFQGVKDYFPEVRVKGRYLGTKGEVRLDSEGNPGLSVSNVQNQEIVLSRSAYSSGVNSACQTPFEGGSEKELYICLLPFDSTQLTDLQIKAEAVYGSYSLSLPSASAPIAAGDYVHIDDTLRLLPPPLPSKYDENRPIGYGHYTSTGDSTYVIDGGSRGKRTVVLSATGDDGERVRQAIYNNDIIILDGSKGDFIYKTYTSLENTASTTAMLKNKTIVGVNGAYLHTVFHLTPEHVKKLKNSGLGGLSQSSGTGAYLYDPSDTSGFYQRWKDKHNNPDGTEYNVSIDNDMEVKSRRAMIDILSDPLESYRDSTGIWRFKGAENVIIRNVKLRGGGAVDVNGQDAICLTIRDVASNKYQTQCGSNHVWVDHCEFFDGTDGNFDIGGDCDYLSISWTHQRYEPDVNYGHKYSCLISGGMAERYRGKMHITFDFCKWGEGISCRTPMMRYGSVHMLNNYYSYRGGTYMLDILAESSILIDRCYFTATDGTWMSSRSNAATAIVFKDNYQVPAKDLEKAKGEFAVPYAYNYVESSAVNYIVESGVGPTLTNPLDFVR